MQNKNKFYGFYWKGAFVLTALFSISSGQNVNMSYPREILSSTLFGTGFGAVLKTADINGDGHPEIIASTSYGGQNNRWLVISYNQSIRQYTVIHSSFLYNDNIVSAACYPAASLTAGRFFAGFQGGKVLRYKGFENIPSDTFVLPRYLYKWVSYTDTLWDSLTYVPRKLFVDKFSGSDSSLSIIAGSHIFLYDMATHLRKASFGFADSIVEIGRISADSAIKLFLANGDMYSFGNDSFHFAAHLPYKVTCSNYTCVGQIELASFSDNGRKKIVFMQGDQTGSRLSLINPANGSIVFSDSLAAADRFWIADINNDHHNELLIRKHQTAADSLECMDSTGAMLWTRCLPFNCSNLACGDFDNDGTVEIASLFQQGAYNSVYGFAVLSGATFAAVFSQSFSTEQLLIDIGDPQKSGEADLVTFASGTTGGMSMWNLATGNIIQRKASDAVYSLAVSRKPDDPGGIFIGTTSLIWLHGSNFSTIDTIVHPVNQFYGSPYIGTVFPFTSSSFNQPVILYGYISGMTGYDGMVWDYQSLASIQIATVQWKSKYDGNYWDRMRKKAMAANLNNNSIPDILCANHHLTTCMDLDSQYVHVLDSCWVFDVARKLHASTDIVAAGTEIGNIVIIDSTHMDTWNASRREIGGIAVLNDSAFDKYLIIYASNARVYVASWPDKVNLWTSPALAENAGSKITLKAFSDSGTVFIAASVAGSFHCYAFSARDLLSVVRPTIAHMYSQTTLRKIAIASGRFKSVPGSVLYDILGRRIQWQATAAQGSHYRKVANGIYLYPVQQMERR
jgi:hypothetical protein